MEGERTVRANFGPLDPATDYVRRRLGEQGDPGPLDQGPRIDGVEAEVAVGPFHPTVAPLSGVDQRDAPTVAGQPRRLC